MLFVMNMRINVVIFFILQLGIALCLVPCGRERFGCVAVLRMTKEQQGLGYFRLAGDEMEVALELQLLDQSTIEEKVYQNLLYAYDNLPPDEIKALTNILFTRNDLDVKRTRKVIIDLIKNADIIQEKILSNAQGYSEEYLIDDLRVIRSQLRLNTRDLLPDSDENYIEILSKMFTKKDK